MSVGDLYDVERTGKFAVAPTRIRRPRPVAKQAPAEQPKAGASGGVPITVLTTDAALADAIHDAAASAHPVATATTPDEALELAAHGRCGILITDQVATHPVLRRMTQRLREAEPAVVVIAVGSAGDQKGLISLLSAGVVDRLMMKPVAPALAQIVLKSAGQQHRTLKGPGTAVTVVEQREPAVVLVELQRDAANQLTEAKLDLQPSPAEIVVPASMATPAKTWRRIDVPRPPWIAVVAALLAVAGLMWWMAAEREPAIDAQAVIASNLAAGQRAFREGHALEPRGHSALDHYNTVLALDPANAAARQGIDQIADRFAAQAGAAIAQGQVAAAIVAVESIRRVRPDHRQLPQLQAQLAAAQEKYIATVPERAEPAPQPAKAAPKASVLTRSLEQDVIAARARTVAQAAEALKRNQLELASALLSEARMLGVPAAELTAMNQTLASAQQRRAKDELLQRVLQRTAESKLLEPADDSAKFHLQRLVELDAKFAGVPQAVAALGGRLTLDAQLATAEKNFDLATLLLAQAREIGFSGAALESAEAKLAAALKPVEPLAAAPPAPRVTRMVRPDYPQDALLIGAEGWVNVGMSVTPAGNVFDPRVVESSNGTMFNRAALAAVRKWKYEPLDAAEPQATRSVMVRVDFRMKGRR